MAIKKLLNGYLVDIQPGGREGKRIRKIFLTKAHAEHFERGIYLDQERRSIDLGSSLSVCELIDMFTNQYAKLRFRGFKSEKSRIGIIRQFFEKENKPISAVRLIDADGFVSQRMREGKKPGTINRDINILKRIFTWAVEHDYLPYSPFEKKLKHLKGANVRVRWLTESECKKLLASSTEVSQRIHDTILFALNTGFRLGNVKAVEVNDIKGEFIYARRTKSGQPYEVPMSSVLRLLLPGIIASQHEAASPSKRLLETSNLRSEFEEAVKKAGFSQDPDDTNKVTFHTLRHTFAAYWLQRGVPIYTVSKWMGHSSIKMTESVYGHLSQAHHIEQMREAEERRQNVDSGIIPFPENDSKTIGVDGIRTRGLRLDREEPCL